jgi:hypothetical protein
MIVRLLADFVLVLHLAFVIFIVLGGLLGLRWRSVLYVHLPTLVWGVLVQCFFFVCPLTALENWLRRLGGEAGYAGGFIEHYILLLLYPRISYWFQAMLGLALIIINLAVYSYVFISRGQKARRAQGRNNAVNRTSHEQTFHQSW